MDAEVKKVLAHRCPRCEAAPGKCCTSPRGWFYEAPHAERERLAVRARLLAEVKKLRHEVRNLRAFMAATDVEHDECLGTGGIEKAKDCRPCKGHGVISVLKLYTRENRNG